MKLLAALALSVGLCSPVLGCDPAIPAEYDYIPDPYPKVFRTTPGNLWAYCRDRRAIACAFDGRTAIAVIDDDSLLGLGYDAEEVDCLFRHEYAHINGWPPDHPP